MVKSLETLMFTGIQLARREVLKWRGVMGIEVETEEAQRTRRIWTTTLSGSK